MVIERDSLDQELQDSLREAVAAFGRFQIRYALIGGIGVGFRSRPRATADVDFLLEVPQLLLPGLLENLGERGFQFDLKTTIREWTQHHITVLRFGSVQNDWLKPVLPAYRHVLDTSRLEQLFGQSVCIASAEGLVLTKLIAFRPQDKADIMNLLAANRDQIDLDWIRAEWKPFEEEDRSRLLEFENMIDNLDMKKRRDNGG